MAFPNHQLIHGLRSAAQRLKDGWFYAWGHHGACNCGHLLQATTTLTREEILTYAHTGNGEWSELVLESCPISETPLTLLLSHLENLGLTPTDIHQLEYLENRKVLEQLPGGFRWLKRNIREDVILYFETYADLLEAAWHRQQHRRRVHLESPAEMPA